MSKSINFNLVTLFRSHSLAVLLIVLAISMALGLAIGSVYLPP